jgi:hypothetical protein
MKYHLDKRELVRDVIRVQAEKWPHIDLTTILREGVSEELFTAYRAYQRITTGEE